MEDIVDVCNGCNGQGNVEIKIWCDVRARFKNIMDGKNVEQLNNYEKWEET